MGNCELSKYGGLYLLNVMNDVKIKSGQNLKTLIRMIYSNI